MSTTATGLSNLAYVHIRKKLLGGGFPGGSMLSETTLAKEIGISRTPVREAIAQLEREGLLDQIPRYGTFVRVMDRNEIAELYEFRAELEGFAAAQAAKHTTQRMLFELSDSCRQMMKVLRQTKAKGSVGAEVGQEWLLLDAGFHTIVLRAANNRWVAKAAGDMRLMTQIFGQWQEMPGRDLFSIWTRTWREHRRLVRALRAHDGVMARDIVKSHIDRGKQKTLEYYDWANCNRTKADMDQLPNSLREQLRNLERYAEITDRLGQDIPRDRGADKR